MSNFAFIAVALFASGLAAVLLWVLYASGKKRNRSGLMVLESAPQHLCNMGPIRRSLGPADFQYALERGGPELGHRLRRERRRVVLLYLAAIAKDFEQLLRVAQVVALLSPEVSGMHEYERLRLSLIFLLRFHLVKLRFRLGFAAFPQLALLGQMVTSLALQMEAAMGKMGERAIYAAEAALQSER